MIKIFSVRLFTTIEICNTLAIKNGIEGSEINRMEHKVDLINYGSYTIGVINRLEFVTTLPDLIFIYNIFC